MIIPSIVFLCSAADHPSGLTVEQLPQEPGSFRVSWTPPASSANLTGYHIYYSGADDSGSVDVGASATNITIGSRTAGVTYSITMVALSPHLPSPVIGPVTVALGEKHLHAFNRHNDLICDGPILSICNVDSLTEISYSHSGGNCWQGG